MLWWLATLAALIYGGGILSGAIDAPGDTQSGISRRGGALSAAWS